MTPHIKNGSNMYVAERRDGERSDEDADSRKRSDLPVFVVCESIRLSSKVGMRRPRPAHPRSTILDASPHDGSALPSKICRLSCSRSIRERLKMRVQAGDLIILMVSLQLWCRAPEPATYMLQRIFVVQRNDYVCHKRKLTSTPIMIRSSDSISPPRLRTCDRHSHRSAACTKATRRRAASSRPFPCHSSPCMRRTIRPFCGLTSDGRGRFAIQRPAMLEASPTGSPGSFHNSDGFVGWDNSIGSEAAHRCVCEHRATAYLLRRVVHQL